MTDEDDEVESHLRRTCAWCGSVWVDGSWQAPDGASAVPAPPARLASHTICPACFERIVPGGTYPGG